MSDQYPEAAGQDIDEQGRPLARQEDEGPGSGTPGVDVGQPDAIPADQTADADTAESAEGAEGAEGEDPEDPEDPARPGGETAAGS